MIIESVCGCCVEERSFHKARSEKRILEAAPTSRVLENGLWFRR